MISINLKLRLNKEQETKLEEWLWHLTGVYNWALRKIELDAKDGIYHSEYDLKAMLTGHSKKIGVAAGAMTETAKTAHIAWKRCFKKLGGKPKFKGERNQLNSIPFRSYFNILDKSHITIHGFSNSVRFHKQNIPSGNIKTGRIIKKPSGWYLSLVIDAAPKVIPILGDGIIGIDPGYSSHVVLSNGEKVFPNKYYHSAIHRLGQAQRGGNKRLTARIHERIANKRRNSNHQLSRRLVSENKVIFFSKDNITSIKKNFGKSADDAGHYQLRSLLAYKCRLGGRQYTEVNSKNSTRACSTCDALTGPQGRAGLAVRHWKCVECGSSHDRDVNAAINTLNAGLGISLGVLKPTKRSSK